jgi:sulfur-oxidizing protein SoxY
MIVKQALKYLGLAAVVSVTASVSQAFATTDLPDDPLNSVMWENMATRFFPGEVVIDQRVIVSAPHDAEDQMQVPITIDATQLDDVVEVVALADLNPIPHILTLRPTRAQAFIGFRIKLEQASPVRVGVKTSDGIWHVNGVIVNAAGGGCTAPALAHGMSDWYKTLGETRAITLREDSLSTRLSMRMRHPMDTGLAPGIPVFYMSDVEVTSPDGEKLAHIEMFEPVSENPTLTLKPLVDDNIDELLVYARDTEANEFRFSLPVPATADN